MRKFIVNIQGNKYEVEVEEVLLENSSYQPQTSNIEAKPVEIKKAVNTASNSNGTKISAPMPGMVKAYKVNDGATVKEGDVILVLEAMKMDNDIVAPCNGVISFKASVGSNVDTGDVMAVIG